MKTRLFPLLVALASLGAASIVRADGYDFAMPSYHATGSRPDAVATGDVDGDGRVDVVMATSMLSDPENDFHLWIYRNRENGTLSLESRFAWDPGSYIRDVTLGMHDMDGDGTDEILLGSGTGLSVYVEDGEGGFLHQKSALAGGCTALTVFDADADRHADVLCLSQGTNGRLYYGDGDGWFSRSREVGTAAFGYEDVASGDLDEDGDIDVAVLAYGGIALLHNDGTGRFTRHVTYGGAPDYHGFSSIAVGDFDGDGRNDVAAAVPANQAESVVAVYLQGDSGRLTAARTTATLDLARDLATRDLDGDGDADLVVVHGFNGLGRYIADAGSLGEELLTPGLNVRAGGDSLALGDVDGDGCVDAAAAYHAGLAVYPGKCLTEEELREFAFAPAIEVPIPVAGEVIGIGDFDANGRDDVVVSGGLSAEGSRTFIYLRGPTAAPVRQAIGSDAIALADLNRDGATDIALDHGLPAALLVSDGQGGFGTDVLMLGQDEIEDCDLIGVSDVDLDHAPDVVCHARNSGRAMAYPTDGDGSFTGQQLVFQTFLQLGQPQAWVRAMAFADFTGDGVDDMLLSSTAGTRAALFLFPHDGERGYGAPSTHPASHDVPGSAIAVGDFNKDGRLDAAITAGASGHVTTVVYLQHPDGGFQAPLDFGAPSESSVAQGVDLDRNGADDLVSYKHNSVQRYMQAGGLIDTTWIEDEVFLTRAPAVGDLDGDGCNDLAGLSYTASMPLLWGVCDANGNPGDGGGGDDGGDDGGNGDGDGDDGDGTGDGSGDGDGDGDGEGGNDPDLPARDVRSDFDGDGHSDLAWRHALTGSNAIWPGGNSTTQQVVARVQDIHWTIAGTGDFDGNGQDDLLWRHGETGQNQIWSGGNAGARMPIPNVRDTGWIAAGTGDLDGDGKDDLVWRHQGDGRNAVWLSADARSPQRIFAVRNTDWEISGVADFNGDGQDDLLWHNPVTGANTIWHSGDPTSQDNITDITDLTWDVAGVGDFNGDGHGDILWRHGTDGRNVIWRAGQFDDQQAVRTVADTDWQVAAVGDYDGDGESDIVWRHLRSGRNILWRSADPDTQLPVTNVLDTDWEVMP